MAIRWRSATVRLSIDDDVRATRGEGSCYLLSIGTLAEEAERNDAFTHRRRLDPALQGDFRMNWELLAGMSKERGANTVRNALCAHMWRHAPRFQHLFTLEPPRRQWGDLLLMAKELRLADSMSAQEDDLNLVQKWGLYFLLRTTHADESYMRVLLDWLENKVAIMNFGRIQQESGNMRYYHLPLSDLVDNDDAILLVKILNIEHQGASRGLLNHFDLVCGQNPVEFLQDLAPAPDRIVAGRDIIDLTSDNMEMTTVQIGQTSRKQQDILCSAQAIQDQKVQTAEQALQSTEMRLRTLSPADKSRARAYIVPLGAAGEPGESGIGSSIRCKCIDA